MERERLVEIFGGERVITDPEILREHRDDLSEYPGELPAAVVYPTAVEEIQALLRLAKELGCSITPRVANTNIGGLALAAAGGIIADLTRMDRVIEVDADNMVAVIEPGVTQGQLKQYLVDHELPLTLGFSLAPPYVSVMANCLLDGLTNRSLKYGAMSEWISGLEMVRPDGSLLKTGAWAVDGIPPYGRPPMPDLTGVFTSFQGTTGICTKLAFQLWPKHPLEKRLFILGYSSAGVFDAVQRLCRMEICEDIGGLSWPPAKMLMGVERPRPTPDPDEPTYFLYVDLAAELPDEMAYKEKLLGQVIDELRARGERFEAPLDIYTLVKVNPPMVAFAEFPTDLEFLSKPRGGGLTWMGTYGPLPRFAETAERCSALMIARGFPPAIVSRPMRGGHFGVLRFLIVFDRSDADEVARVKQCMQALLEEVTASGFLMYKTPAWALKWLKAKIDPGMKRLAREVKQLMDPDGLLNPGKLDL